MMTRWLTACLILGACTPGDFCDVVTSELSFAPETARAIVRTDRDEANQIAVQNEYGRKTCSWARQ